MRPDVVGCRGLIEKEVEADTRRLDPFEAFRRATDGASGAGWPPPGGGSSSPPTSR